MWSSQWYVVEPADAREEVKGLTKIEHGRGSDSNYTGLSFITIVMELRRMANCVHKEGILENAK